MALVVCPTPIGNLEDVTMRVLREFGEASLILCEDTRRTRRLLDRYAISAKLMSYHQHNEAARTQDILPRLVGGERIALASDAGLPSVSDPGARLIRAAIDGGVEVVVLPGPSAVETALVASGLIGERYLFIGYAPRSDTDREHLWQELADTRLTTVAFESPNRLAASLGSLATAQPERPVAVCRELTKRFEEVVRGSAEELAERFSDPVKGEVTLVIGPSEFEAEQRAGLEAAVKAVSDLVAAGTQRRTASAVISELTGESRKRLYDESL